MSDELKAFLIGGLPMLVIGVLAFIGIYQFVDALCDKLGLL